MKFLIITHVKHRKQNNQYFAYAPYVREMNIWLKHVDEVTIVAPLSKDKKTIIDEEYVHAKINFNKIHEIEFTSFLKSLISIVKIPYIVLKIFNACFKTDHIHLRCPGNIGLLGCFVQIFFPKKMKTAKYAGNWDPNSKQPISYNVQKYILKNIFLTKNMQTLVYGQWPNQSKNIRPFFTASYSNSEIEPFIERNYKGAYRFIFIGTIVPGKRPILALKIIDRLRQDGIDCKLDVYGEGELIQSLQDYVLQNKLQEYVNIHGNVGKESLISALKTSDFLLLPSKSEGWPKAVAEAMFFGVIPITTNVSCLSWMLDEGRRGILIENNLNEAAQKIKMSIRNDNLLSMSIASQQWSQKYTLEKFEIEIKKLL